MASGLKLQVWSTYAALARPMKEGRAQPARSFALGCPAGRFHAKPQRREYSCVTSIQPNATRQHSCTRADRHQPPHPRCQQQRSREMLDAPSSTSASRQAGASALPHRHRDSAAAQAPWRTAPPARSAGTRPAPARSPSGAPLIACALCARPLTRRGAAPDHAFLADA
ncbi:hypothetical protein WOLCODRAFT_165597 [Wolfiporia cocos MD-104 SS10]|uniref:Uncharacterized protein n=1 Tax=Wolfiporia cocos (strain MD-104) TaxID=742152 RepID=A0A2H3K7N9_WOLCO|nr:hypothetical protein WOLCODRAFT_165597 [Wolfiporia cocos MD-104 SS10]